MFLKKMNRFLSRIPVSIRVTVWFSSVIVILFLIILSSLILIEDKVVNDLSDEVYGADIENENNEETVNKKVLELSENPRKSDIEMIFKETQKMLFSNPEKAKIYKVIA